MAEEKEDYKETLKGISEKDYGDQYRPHALEIYKLYLEMADRISSRRERANTFFLTLNTAIVGFVGYVNLSDKPFEDAHWITLISIAGIILSLLWQGMIRSYKNLNTAKFQVVHQIEKSLPLRPYDAEWVFVGGGEDKKRYNPFTHIEQWIPWIFLGLHLFVFARVFPWDFFCFGFCK